MSGVIGHTMIASGSREAVAADFGVMPEPVQFKPSTSYGEPHPANNGPHEDMSQLTTPHFYFYVASEASWSTLGGYFPRDEFNWLAKRLGTPPLSDEKDVG